MKLTPQKLEGWGYRTVRCKFRINFNRFCIHPCVGRTDGRARQVRPMLYCRALKPTKIFDIHLTTIVNLHTTPVYAKLWKSCRTVELTSIV